MNLMYAALNNTLVKNSKINLKITKLQEVIKTNKIKFQDKPTILGNSFYYQNILPNISKSRDVLKKPEDVCKLYLNWKNKKIADLNTNDMLSKLKPQYGWMVTTVDAEHTRNRFKNKMTLWVVFDSESEAIEKMNLFNSMFITAIELDCIQEYKKFKENPEKRPLTFDKLVSNAYDLYEAVDNGEF